MLALTLLYVPLSMADEKAKITGIYSSLNYNEEGGDLLGEEIFIVYGGHGNYFASVQCAQGGIRAPFITPVFVNNSEISFEVPQSEEHLCTTGVFNGVITESGLIGEFAESHMQVNLPRGNSYWQ